MNDFRAAVSPLGEQTEVGGRPSPGDDRFRGCPTIVFSTTVPATLRFLVGQVEYMVSKGARVVLLSSPGPELRQAASVSGASEVAIPMVRRPALITDFLGLIRHFRLFLQIRPRIVCASTPKAGLLGMMAARLTGVPVRVYLVRGLPLSTASAWQAPLLWLAEALSCRLASHVQCVSHSLREDMIRRGLVSPSRSSVLGSGSSNGVDTDARFNPDRRPAMTRERRRSSLGIPSDAVVVGFVGRITRDKGIAELADAWRLIVQVEPRAHLLVIGPIEGRDTVTRDAVESLRSSPNVTMQIGFHEADPYYEVMDLLVLPSHREGFPNVVLEASAMALPVVTTDAVGCSDSVVAGVTGLVVPVGDARALAKAISSYLFRPDLRHLHGQAARARAIRDFRPQSVWHEQLRSFLRLIESSGSRPFAVLPSDDL